MSAIEILFMSDIVPFFGKHANVGLVYSVAAFSGSVAVA
jgi:hypothetical protein